MSERIKPSLLGNLEAVIRTAGDEEMAQLPDPQVVAFLRDSRIEYMKNWDKMTEIGGSYMGPRLETPYTSRNEQARTEFNAWVRSQQELIYTALGIDPEQPDSWEVEVSSSMREYCPKAQEALLQYFEGLAPGSSEV